MAPLVIMIKRRLWKLICIVILLIFYLKKSQNSNLSLDNKNLKWGGKYNYEINVFLKYTLATINGILLFNTFEIPFASLIALTFLL